MKVCPTSYSDQAIALAPDDAWPYLFKTITHWSWHGADKISRAILNSAPYDETHEWYLWSWYFQHIGEGNYQEAFELIERTKEDWLRNKWSAMPVKLLSACLHSALKEKQKARPLFELSVSLLRDAVENSPEDPRYHSSLGLALAGIGESEEAVIEGERATALLPFSENAFYGVPYLLDLALIHTLNGEVEQALIRLEFLLQNPTYITPEYLQVDFRFVSLYEHPAFVSLMERCQRKEK